jgi:peptidoglycan/xylan/chitin deacetylase (PgdA/CDA1 family)
MKRKILILILTVAKHTGLFALCRVVTARHLRILCYHGCAVRDEDGFSPGTFMTGATFEKRMQYLTDANYPTLPLGDALTKLEEDALPRNATVITIDDGWYGTFKFQYPVLRKNEFPATLYIASYYLHKQTQVFNMALGYVLWSSGECEIDLSKFGFDLSRGIKDGRIIDAEDVCVELNEIADSLDGAAARQLLLRKFCDGVGFDWQSLEDDRLLSFMNSDEALEIASNEIDIQLHTHRHRFPNSTFDAAHVEIEDNRVALADIAQSDLRHFCYPSGVYSAKGLSYLQDLGIDSATTTNPGFNRKDTPHFELLRFLDSELISDLEFEAEMSGFFELIRSAGNRI